jgi:hypothetical protein
LALALTTLVAATRLLRGWLVVAINQRRLALRLLTALASPCAG